MVRELWFVIRICRAVWKELWHNLSFCDGCQVSAYKRTLKNLQRDLDVALADHYQGGPVHDAERETV